ncbi:MAG: MBL fold metallo-hydrolase [Oscillospiraceae bacterium]|nr:MBL fold metallo-hydrolase [Oscillospiraceae bacterium]
MEITTIASGSKGNCAFVHAGDTSLLIDAGISYLRIKNALEELGTNPKRLSGVFVTHEHSDHVKGLLTLLKRTELPVYAPMLVAKALRGMLPCYADRICTISVRQPIKVNGVTVTAFETPHDTPQSVGYRVDHGSESFSLCTDLGHITDEVLDHITYSGSVVIESNHDVTRLRLSSYPKHLQERILSNRGHLSNEACARMAIWLAEHDTKQFVLGHISQESNTPRMAMTVVGGELEKAGYGHLSCQPAPANDLLTIIEKGAEPC